MSSTTKLLGGGRFGGLMVGWWDGGRGRGLVVGLMVSCDCVAVTRE